MLRTSIIGGTLPAMMLAALSLQSPVVQAASVPAAAAHPDLSGIWTVDPEPGGTIFGPRVGQLPFTPLGRRKVDEYRSLVGPDDNPGAHCLGSGMPEAMTFSGIYPMEIIQRPEQITIIYEAHEEIRRLYFGAKILAPGDRVPDREGYSTAHWDGATLVVDTSSLKEQEDQSYPHSEQARIEERYHLTTGAKGGKVLVADWTLTDPMFYTRPVKAEKKWLLDPHGVLLPYECNEEGWLDHLDHLRKLHDSAAHQPATAQPPARAQTG